MGLFKSIKNAVQNVASKVLPDKISDVVDKVTNKAYEIRTDVRQEISRASKNPIVQQAVVVGLMLVPGVGPVLAGTAQVGFTATNVMAAKKALKDLEGNYSELPTMTQDEYDKRNAEGSVLKMDGVDALSLQGYNGQEIAQLAHANDITNTSKLAPDPYGYEAERKAKAEQQTMQQIAAVLIIVPLIAVAIKGVVKYGRRSSNIGGALNFGS